MTEKKRGIKNEPKSVMVSLKEFSRDSVNFFEKCKKPSKLLVPTTNLKRLVLL